MKKWNRNSICWCGSSKKYKRCHYDFDERIKFFKHQGYPVPAKHLIKSAAEIEGIAQSCSLTKRLLDELNDQVKPGVSTNHLNDWVYTQTIHAGAKPAPLNYKGFPKSICTSVNEVICHGIPSDYVLKEGDLLNIDITCILNGYYGDSCRMYEVGSVSKDAQKINKVSKECLHLAIEAIRPWDSVSIIGDTIEKHAHSQKFSVVNEFGGHGIGTSFHDEPFIYHCKRKEKQMIMVPGMVFTIEPMINQGVAKSKILADGWTAVTADGLLSAQWEHTIVITDTGARILT